QAVDAVGNLLLLPRQFLGALLCVADVPLRAIAQRPFELSLRFTQTIERLLRLRRRGRVAAGRCPAHRVCCFTHLPCGVEQIGTVFLPREAFQPPRRFLRLLGEGTLLCAAARCGRRTSLLQSPLAFGFLLLPASQLLQFLEQFVNLTIAIGLHLPIGRLVAARHLVELLLEDVGQLALLRRSAAATAAALLGADLHLVFLSRLRQQRERLVPRPPRLMGCRPPKFTCPFLPRRH